jgi:hypothetical protein
LVFKNETELQRWQLALLSSGGLRPFTAGVTVQNGSTLSPPSSAPSAVSSAASAPALSSGSHEHAGRLPLDSSDGSKVRTRLIFVFLNLQFLLASLRLIAMNFAASFLYSCHLVLTCCLSTVIRSAFQGLDTYEPSFSTSAQGV